MGDSAKVRPASAGRLCAAALALVPLLALAAQGCRQVAYYGQAVAGQVEILNLQEPLPRLIEDPATPEALRQRLALVMDIRRFAESGLSLPAGGHYLAYADLGRPFAVYSVFAAPEFSLTPKTWCYPVIGCAAYRGYFSATAAREYAAGLREASYDVYVAGVPAYSTLGWFRDPVLNTFIHREPADLAALVFHELAHQVLYVRDDTTFNESFAKVFVVEGYFDLLALFQNGIRNAVATLGTALTETHLRMLKGFAEKVYLVYDADAAGLKAALRSTELFIRESVDARIVVLPRGEDPDSFLRRSGPGEFRRAAGQALGIFSFLIESAVAAHGLTLEGKVRVVEDMVSPLGGIEDHVVRSLYVKELAERVGVDESALLDKVRQAGAAPRARPSPGPAPKARDGVPAPGGSRGRRYRLEERIVAMMLQFPEILGEVKRRQTIERFEDRDLQAIGRVVLAGGGGRPLAASLIERIEDGRQQQVAARLAIGADPWDRAGCLRLLGQYDAGRRGREAPLMAEIKAAEEAGDQELLLRLLKDKQRRAASKSQRGLSSQPH